MVTPGALFGVRPDDGSLAWLERFERVSGYMVTPMLLDDGRLFVSTPDVGSRAYALRHDGGKTVLEQVWHSRKLRMAFMNPVQIGEYIIGSSGPNPGILTAIDAASGERVWADRSFAQATLLCADGKLILLDENGNLALGMVTRDGLIHYENGAFHQTRHWYNRCFRPAARRVRAVDAAKNKIPYLAVAVWQ